MERGTATEIPDSPWWTYRDGVLCCDEAPLPGVAERFGTPTFVYAARAIDAAYDAIEASVPPCLIAYAIKANSNLSLLRRLAERGCGADIVSGGELARCLRAGVDPKKIVFSGVGKTDQELRAALDAGIRAVHVESLPEIDALEAIARERGEKAPMTLRVNPDVDPDTHPYIATGLHGTKFGLELDVARSLLPRLVASEHLSLEGVACHVGSHSPTVILPSRGSVHVPRSLSVSTVTRNLSASVLRLKVRARSVPEGSRYRTCHRPVPFFRMCAISSSFNSRYLQAIADGNDRNRRLRSRRF